MPFSSNWTNILELPVGCFLLSLFRFLNFIFICSSSTVFPEIRSASAVINFHNFFLASIRGFDLCSNKLRSFNLSYILSSFRNFRNFISPMSLNNRLKAFEVDFWTSGSSTGSDGIVLDWLWTSSTEGPLRGWLKSTKSGCIVSQFVSVGCSKLSAYSALPFSSSWSHILELLPDWSVSTWIDSTSSALSCMSSCSTLVCDFISSGDVVQNISGVLFSFLMALNLSFIFIILTLFPDILSISALAIRYSFRLSDLAAAFRVLLPRATSFACIFSRSIKSVNSALPFLVNRTYGMVGVLSFESVSTWNDSTGSASSVEIVFLIESLFVVKLWDSSAFWRSLSSSTFVGEIASQSSFLASLLIVGCFLLSLFRFLNFIFICSTWTVFPEIRSASAVIKSHNFFLACIRGFDLDFNKLRSFNLSYILSSFRKFRNSISPMSSNNRL